MPKNDEGEFELILGNRQLISVFLIVVILLGVFFSMGYIVGRNSAAAAPAETARSDKAAPPETAPPTPDSSTPPEPAPAAQQPDTAPTATTPATQPEAAAPPPPKPEKAEKAAKVTKPKPAPAPPPVSHAPEHAAASGQPGPGDYWQVVATARPDAEIIAETINKRGFHAILAPAPKEGVFRVLVGPLEDAATQAKTRTGLEAAGFKNPILRKY